MGHSSKRPDNGVWQYGREIRHRRRVHTQPGQRRKLLLRRILSQRTGRRRRRGHQDAGTGQRGFKERPQQGTGIPRKGNAENLQGTIRHAEDDSKSITAICSISNSQSKASGSGCCNAEWANAMARRRCVWQSIW